ncbi:MAG: hypothetical protein KGJ23_10085 [Euryarchaeota archaeon]|nr:hypothetical protein [Euryarchaeota archaeon]MDE1836953.1 hypothetical protein [Euryarchaeota archaeon]MDE1881927.1 hypothetical protein [Euryarchaeota archaeon]MDE2045862.1 hypothetical protein [Thermoplasmata archaeon]
MKPLRRRDGAIGLGVLNTWVAGAMVWTWWQGGVGYSTPDDLAFYLGLAPLIVGSLAGYVGARWRTHWVALASGLTMGLLAAATVPTAEALVAGPKVGALAAGWAALLCSMPLEDPRSGSAKARPASLGEDRVGDLPKLADRPAGADERSDRAMGG